MPKNTDAASQLSPKPSPTSSGATESKIWTSEDKKVAKEEYWINIHESDCALSKSDTTDLPTNSYIVDYTVDNSDELHHDIVIAAKRVDVFNFYWDKLKKGLKDIRYTRGNKRPNLWGNQPPTPTKKKRKKND